MTFSDIPDRHANMNIASILCPIFGESRLPGNSQIPDPVNILIVLPILAPCLGQIPNPENTLPDPVIRLKFVVICTNAIPHTIERLSMTFTAKGKMKFPFANAKHGET